MPVPPTPDYTHLIQEAIKAAQNAYAPYSNYRVGAALLTAGGNIYHGCNVENAAYGCTICAEQTAISKAVSEGERAFTALVVVTADGGAPCGPCRQVMREFAPQLTVIIADAGGHARIRTLSQLLPDSFGPENLNR
ncbi:MAG: cytidine deaminase [Anaerolineae bacterium]